jgi:hypothetical protein
MKMQCFYIVEGSMFKLLCWRMPCVPKKIGDGPIKWLLLGRRENINENQLWVQPFTN